MSHQQRHVPKAGGALLHVYTNTYQNTKVSLFHVGVLCSIKQEGTIHSYEGPASLEASLNVLNDGKAFNQGFAAYDVVSSNVLEYHLTV